MEAEAKSKGGEGIEETILRAIRARVSDFKEQANSMTLENVRRTLEKDLGMNAFTLDSHKRFIKRHLEECFDVAEDTNKSKDSGEKLENSVLPENQKLVEQTDDILQPKEQKDCASGSDVKAEVIESTGDTGARETNEVKSAIDLSEDMIKRAIKRRASYFRANSEKISLVGVRRLLEEDLKLEKNTLDAYKKMISKQLDEVLQTPEVVEPKKHTGKGTPDRKAKGSAGVSRSEASDDSSGSSVSRSENEEIDEEEAKLKKRSAQKVRKNGLLKKQKISTEGSKPRGSGKKKNAEPAVEKTSETEDVGNSSEEAHSHSSEEEAVKKKRATPAQTYGKRVEHLKSVIKTCGMGVPPSIYKRVKQAPESKRESYLIKELEDILSREGLSTNPSEKEIKAVRKKKERAKELEGIDLSNIVSSTRRRTTSSFIVPPKPEVPSESDEDGEEEEDEDSDDGNNDSGVSSEENDEDGNEESE